MAKVVNQDLPLEDIEDELDPPIPFLDQYRRTLSEGIDHPKYPAGTEGVNSTKRGARMAQRDTNPYFDKPAAREWRDDFKECLDCWNKQANFEEDIDPCTKQGSKHWTQPGMPKRAKRSVYFKLWMENCLNFRAANPGVEWTWCDEDNPPDDAPDPVLSFPSQTVPCGGSMDITVDNAFEGCAPYQWSISGGGEISGEEGSTITFDAPGANAGCSLNINITVSDKWGHSASVDLAVNCYSGGGNAQHSVIQIGLCCYKITEPDCAGMGYQSASCTRTRYWDCSGALISDVITGNTYCFGLTQVCPPPPPCVNLCECEGAGWGACAAYSGYVDVFEDLRTEEMENGGCCPIDPLTASWW